MAERTPEQKARNAERQRERYAERGRPYRYPEQTPGQRERYAERRREREGTPEWRAIRNERQREYRAFEREREQPHAETEAAPSEALRAPTCTCGPRAWSDPRDADEPDAAYCGRCGKRTGVATR